jgi:hypothetical protein
MISNKKLVNYKVIGYVETYNFGVDGRRHQRSFDKFKKKKSKIRELKTNIYTSRLSQVKKWFTTKL